MGESLYWIQKNIDDRSSLKESAKNADLNQNQIKKDQLLAAPNPYII